MNNMRQTVRQCTVVPNIFSTLQFSVDETVNNNKSAIYFKGHLHQTDLTMGII